MKNCRKCREDKPFESFPPRKSSKDGKHSYCRSCLSGMMKEAYHKNPKRKNDRNESLRIEIRKEVETIKAKAGCKCCPEREPACLDFHHLNSEEKEDTIANLVCKRSRTRLFEEIQKCVVVCSNCHRKIHAGIINIAT
jgi:hypothetical protein